MEQKFASLKLAVNHNELRLVKNIMATERTINGLIVNFDFRTPEWSELTKSAVFIRDGKSYVVLLDSVDECFIPWECLESKGIFMIGVFGLSDKTQLPTNYLEFKVEESCVCAGEKPVDPTPELYAQVLDLCGQANRIAQSVRDDADAGRFNGKDGADGKDGVNGKNGVDGKDGLNGKDGADGLTPHIAANGNWWIGTTDTGVKAKGTDGINGTNGIDGKDGKDGINGEDGKDGLNGSDGKDGADGLTPYIAENGNWWIGETDTGVRAAGLDGKDGVNGVDGISCTHSWDDTILTITSASGTSSADLKGDKGDPYTLTEEDKKTIVDEVLAENLDFFSGSYNDLTDKPCYDEVSYESFYNNPDLWFAEDGGMGWIDLLSLSRPVEPAIGKKYKAVFDGIDYELTCVSYNESDLFYGASLRGNESCPFTVKLYSSVNELPIQEAEIYTTLPGYMHSVEMLEAIVISTPLDDRYIPDSIARVDYVNSKLDDKPDKDHTHSYDDLTDKPLYDDVSYAEFYSLQNMSFYYYNAANSFNSQLMIMPINNDFIPSENYRVVFDGTPYDMKCESISATAYKLVGVDSACPFEVVMGIIHWDQTSELELEITTTTSGDTHDVEIFEIMYTPVPLDEKFIPDSIARVEDVNKAIGNISSALDELHNYAQALSGGAE